MARGRHLFRLIVESSDDAEPVNMIGNGSPFFTRDGSYPKGNVTAAADREPEAWPLGDGTLGSYTNIRTTIRAECRPASGKAVPRPLHVTAVGRYPEVSAEDRQRLARSAMQQLTPRIGCRTQLPSLSARMTAVSLKLRPAASATGSCRWAGQLGKEHGPGRLPDRALTIPAREANPVEGYLLAVGPVRVTPTPWVTTRRATT
ncbi:hypothetical protein AB0E78_36160 [Streptomyces sp. NPDC032198]|uniref:hypothetical protein n=1 Tax=Streptomyces sp. NPDC032198 TaxID=3155127 RepID=UPI0033E7B2B6